MAKFYDVHCTNCGKVLSADRMAIDVDKILKTHLSIVTGRKGKEIYVTAKKLFDEVRVGMYLTKFEMVNAGILLPDGTLRLKCQYILEHIERRYKVELKFERNKEDNSEEEEEDEDSLDVFDSLDEDEEDLDADIAEDSWSVWDAEANRHHISEDTLDSLCFKMALYAELDTEEEAKRDYIQQLIEFLADNKDEIILECNCEFAIHKDDQGQEFIGALRVTYINNEVVAYNHMVCPNCGEPFFIDAGKYEEHIIVMLGSSRVGKTAYLAAIVNELDPEYGQPRYTNITVKDTTDKKYTYFKNAILAPYRRGKKILKTDESKDAVALFSLDISINGRIVIFTFVDLPGEVFSPRDEEEREGGEASGRFIINHRRICYSADAFWFCIAPVQIDPRLHSINEASDGADKVEMDMSTVLSNIGNTINVMGEGKTNAPTAIIITQSDLIDPAEKMYLANRELEPDCLYQDSKFLTERFLNVAANVKRYMTSKNVKNIVTKLENMFENKNYFAVAAYGVKVVVGSEGVNLAPYGVILPFLWTLSVFGYLEPVRYRQTIEKTGLFKKEEKIREYYDRGEIEELFSR